MIISNFVYIIIHNKVKSTYISKKFNIQNIQIGETIKISIEKLEINSHENILVKCDNCRTEKLVRYQAYNKCTKNNSEPYFCNKKECINKKRESVLLLKYNTTNVFKMKSVKDKIKKTNIKNLGVENPQQNKDIKIKTEQTNEKIYGYKNVFQNEKIKQKIKKTNNDKYGVDYPMQSTDIKNKTKKSNLVKYGVEYTIQIREFFNKNRLSALKIKKYNDTDLYYQGSYELDFLNNYYNCFKILNGLSFKYHLNNILKTYHSDFYIPELNLIVEIKNSYLYNRDYDIILEKEKSVRQHGYNYILILDKNYTEYNNYFLTNTN
jgi:very-short-patch-repair endonuclease